MEAKTVITILLVTFMLASCVPAAQAIPTLMSRSDNFSFVFQDYSCSLSPVYVLDTNAGILVYTPLGDTTSITISLRFTSGELDAIYQKAMAIDFFHYPSNFVIPEGQVRGMYSPASKYELSMTNGQ